MLVQTIMVADELRAYMKMCWNGRWHEICLVQFGDPLCIVLDNGIKISLSPSQRVEVLTDGGARYLQPGVPPEWKSTDKRAYPFLKGEPSQPPEQLPAAA